MGTTNFPGPVKAPVFIGAAAGSVPVPGKVLFVDTVNGSDGYDGGAPVFDGAAGPLRSMARALVLCLSGDTIYVKGDVREQVGAPVGVYNVSIIGNGPRPHHDNAVRWRGPASPAATTPLLRLREQGWRVSNILFVAPTDACAIELRRRENAADPDASHAVIDNCRFAGGLSGIEDNGGCHNVLITDCDFQDTTDSAIETTSTTIAVPLRNVIQNCRFQSCVHGIRVSFSQGIIRNNTFQNITTTELNDIFVTAQGANNFVVDNHFHVAGAGVTIAGGFVGSATDVWRNFTSDATAWTVGIPA